MTKAPKKLSGTAVRRIRKALGLSQAALAERLFLHPNSLARIERGEIGMRRSTVELIRRVAAERPSTAATAGRKIRLRD